MVLKRKWLIGLVTAVSLLYLLTALGLGAEPEKPPTKPAPAKTAPYQQAPAKPTPYQQAPAKSTPYQQAPAKPTPYQQAPAKSTPYQQAPAKSTPYQQAPAKSTPYQQAPVYTAPQQQPPLNTVVVKRVPPPILVDGALRQKLIVKASPQVYTNAKVLYRADRNKFSRPAPEIRVTPAHQVVLKKMRIVPVSYYYRRNVFYTHYQYVPPAYVYSLKPRYGIWDTSFLAFMMDRMYEPQYALMYYNHRNETDFLEWRSEMDRLAMDNYELRQNLAAMDQQMAQLEGVPVDPSYFAEDASDIAVSADVIEQLGQA